MSLSLCVDIKYIYQLIKIAWQEVSLALVTKLRIQDVWQEKMCLSVNLASIFKKRQQQKNPVVFQSIYENILNWKCLPVDVAFGDGLVKLQVVK